MKIFNQMLKYKKNEKIIYFNEDGFDSNILSQKLENNIYKILETPLLIESKLYEYGTIVSVEKKTDGKLWIKEVISKSEYKTETYCLSKEAIKSNNFKQLSKKLLKIGGSFDIAMGGLVSIYTPKNIEFDLAKKLDNNI